MIVKDKSVLKALARKYHLEFCSIHGYYEGNAYNNSKGETLPNYFLIGKRVYKLKYFSGCFNPFIVDVAVKMVYSKATKEPVFPFDERLWDKVDQTKFTL